MNYQESGQRNSGSQALQEFDELEGGVYSGPGPASPVGRFRLDGNGSCYWEPNEDGPNSCSISGGGATILNARQSLYPGNSISSPNGRFVLIYQTDGNLVLYDYGNAAWAINCWPVCTGPYSAGVTTMQTDGNFVVYDAGGAPVWHTYTYGNPGAYLALYDDGSLIVHSSGGGTLWSRP
jgi:hypothetical protein